MSITLNTLVYNQDSQPTADKVVYTGPSHTFSVKDQLTLGRTAPKATSIFAGVARSSIKRTKTLTLADSSVHEAIVELTVSLPVGAADADIDALVNDIADFAISTEGTNVIRKHDLTV